MSITQILGNTTATTQNGLKTNQVNQKSNVNNLAQINDKTQSSSIVLVIIIALAVIATVGFIVYLKFKGSKIYK